MRRLLPAILVAVLALLGTVPSAQASTRSKIIADCSDDGVLQGHYTPSQLRDARKHLPSDVAEYTDCQDVLRRAELPDGGLNGGGTATGGAPLPPGGAPPGAGGAVAPPPAGPETEADRTALVEAQHAPDQPVEVGGENLLAGAAPLREGYRANGLPDSLIIALILLGLAGLALSFPPVRRRLSLHRLSFPRLRRS